MSTSGDRLVGEIKSVEKDVLTFSMDFSDADFKIKWDRSRRSRATASSWSRPSTATAVGRAQGRSAQKTAAVVVGDADVRLPDVSTVQPFERSLWSRFDSALDFGTA